MTRTGRSILRPTGQSAISRAQAEGTYGDLYGRLAAVQEALARLGMDIRKQSRFGIYLSALEELHRITADERLSDARRDSLHSALRECDEFVRSVTTLMIEPEVEGWRRVAAKALDGRASVALESGSTPGRDAQFELLVAALVRRAGFAVKFAEPDIKVGLQNGAEVSIAAKRVKSPSKLGRRVSEASRQIARSQQQGILAVDLAFFGSHILRQPDLESAVESLRAETRSLARRHLDEYYQRVDRRTTFGCMLFASKLAQLGEEPLLATVQSIYVTNLCEDTDKRRLLLDTLTAGLSRASSRWLQ